MREFYSWPPPKLLPSVSVLAPTQKMMTFPLGSDIRPHHWVSQLGLWPLCNITAPTATVLVRFGKEGLFPGKIKNLKIKGYWKNISDRCHHREMPGNRVLCKTKEGKRQDHF